ncbi:MAG: succinate dehydrogenase/fumarate reductase flavoprotein subunit [Alphaproteobacteria bacterium CG_4_10_14_0_2_um_filter_63_37]|nr:MAG: succinate dehydrogenase/fumarate reductase flavoprotein subunit [Proteobacteria bacterium CG1_02_64_396]PJA25367.1 MAG: succinate dehydrogenase/fumarate reductase flavoprotein subunit [Alphaproteobacteria bacterium CG_4_10_14_0_2_um_filter_63_37]
MKASMERVRASRAERLARARQGDHVPALSLVDRGILLREFHPDYRDDARREVKVGPNAGDQLPNEVVSLLHAGPRIDINEAQAWLESPEVETDVLILGGGGAGAAAAIAAGRGGAKVVLATKLRFGDSNTVMAEGGIQVADQEADSPIDHFLDIMGGGHFTNVPELVEALVSDGPKVLAWLEQAGMLLDKYPTGRMKARHGGGTSRKRLHSAGDMTGLELMRVVKDEALALGDRLRVLEYCPAVELLTDEAGQCCGAVMVNLATGHRFVVKARAVILATGGFGRLHIQGFPTSNHYGATADGLVMAYRAGAKLTHLRYAQYHPTGIAFPGQSVGLLVTEKVRGLGAQIVNIEGKEFVFALEPRDVTTAALIRECAGGGGVTTPGGQVGVWLDSPIIDLIHGEGTIRKELPGKYLEFMRHGIDITKDPILVYPTLHYQNGGLTIDPQGATTVAGLYACGEVTGGIHGDNRLMGNALLEIMVYGQRAGAAAARYVVSHASGKPGLGHLAAYLEGLKSNQAAEGRLAPMLLPDYRPGPLAVDDLPGTALPC